MNDDAVRALARLLADRGMGVVRDPELCESLLTAACGRHRKEFFLLVTALRNRVVPDLLVKGPGQPVERVVARLGRRLHKSLGLVEEAAVWAVRAWAEALGLYGPPGTPSEDVPRREAEALAVTPDPPAGGRHAAGDGPGLVDASSCRGSGDRFKCPNCAGYLPRGASQQGGEWVTCSGCRWRLKLAPDGAVIDRELVEFRCPRECCGRRFTTLGGGYVQCPHCLTRVRVYGNGVITCYPVTACPGCGGKVFYQPEARTAGCDAWGQLFAVTGEVPSLVPGLHVVCQGPDCGKAFVAYSAGEQPCPHCRSMVYVDDEGRVTGRVGCCPADGCEGTVLVPPGGGDVRCGECDRGFTVSAAGRMVSGFVLRCAFCSEDMEEVEPRRLRCTTCGMVANLDEDGSVESHTDVACCGSCQENYLVRPDTDRCPWCGEPITKHDVIQQPWSNDNNQFKLL